MRLRWYKAADSIIYTIEKETITYGKGNPGMCLHVSDLSHLFRFFPRFPSFLFFFSFSFLFPSWLMMSHDITWSLCHRLIHPLCLFIISPLDFHCLSLSFISHCLMFPYRYCSLSLWLYYSPLYVASLFFPYGRSSSFLYCSLYGLMRCSSLLRRALMFLSI